MFADHGGVVSACSVAVLKWLCAVVPVPCVQPQAVGVSRPTMLKPCATNSWPSRCKRLPATRMPTVPPVVEPELEPELLLPVVLPLELVFEVPVLLELLALDVALLLELELLDEVPLLELDVLDVALELLVLLEAVDAAVLPLLEVLDALDPSVRLDELVRRSRRGARRSKRWPRPKPSCSTSPWAFPTHTPRRGQPGLRSLKRCDAPNS